MRMGLQAKLVLCFMLLLTIALATSAWIVVEQGNARLVDILGEQARQISYALSLASRTSIVERRADELQQIGQDMLKSRNVLYVGFFDTELRPIVMASRDPDFQPGQSEQSQPDVQSLMQVRQLESKLFGDYVEVTAPVLTMSSPSVTGQMAGGTGATRLLGYVSVGLSQAREQAQVRRVNFFVLGIGGLIVLVSLPLASMLVHRVFVPIRQLVDATRRIACGELDVKVAIHRSDVIGTLARSFNEMVQRVKQEQDALEDKVARRTAELERSNGRLMREIAEKEDFLRAVSHDLNAPLRNISGMATMLLMKYRDTFNEDVVHRLERIQKNVKVETDLLSELLELSRIKTRRHKQEQVDLHELVEDLGGMFEQDLSSRQIKLVIDGKLPVLPCERTRMRQVFQNLIDNAIKYMGDSTERRISVGGEQRGALYEFYVRDTGQGIEPDDIDKVFFIFRRGKSAAVQSVAGKGVGLACVKSIIETYGGSIWVESQVNQGTTFRFTIDPVHQLTTPLCVSQAA